MASEFKDLEDALRTAIRERTARPVAGRLRDLIRLARLRHSEISATLAESEKNIGQANEAVAGRPELRQAIKASFGDLDGARQVQLKRLRTLERVIENAEEAERWDESSEPPKS